MTGAGRFGPRLGPDATTFRLWAPAARRVELMLAQDRTAPGPARQEPPDGATPCRTGPTEPRLDRAHVMRAAGAGWYELTVPGAGAGTLYRFRIDGAVDVPDPASAFQPHDVFGPSEVVDHRYDWRTAAWRGRPWHEAVFLELHVGAFTPDGTFLAAIDKLDAVAASGITAIELMPIADFAGARNWGYDGVLPFAPDSAYGRPEHLKALIDAAHARGLMVFLDVVYNHFGPEGNYLGRYAPAFFTAAHTPWGSAIDYRVAEVRAFAIENALHWLRDYRFDGLRLDAVHAIVEPGEPSLLAEMSGAVGALAADTGRLIHLVLENDDNAARLLDPARDPPDSGYRAQWNDDYHHAWHVLLTREGAGYYRDYVDAPAGHVARCLASGFAYQGERSRHRKGARRGEPSGHLPLTAFVNFLQNHDQIGNRALGDRLATLAPAMAVEAALAVTLLAPSPPLLFMGEEWGATEPFPFFCDFSGDLADAVRNGRKAEFAEAYAHLAGDWPDPLAQETFRSAVLDWSARERPGHGQRLELVRRLLDVRRREVVPRLAGMPGGGGRTQLDGAAITAQWRMGDGSELRLLANLGGEAIAPAPRLHGRPIWGGGAAELTHVPAKWIPVRRQEHASSVNLQSFPAVALGPSGSIRPGMAVGPWAVHWAIGDS
jgi:malto-oligosyltrehalose trehalohydrolase